MPAQRARALGNTIVWVTLAASLVAPPAVTQQSSAAAVTLPSDWAVGERYEIEIVRERSRTAPGKPPQVGSHTYIVSVEVRERNEQGYVLAWKLGPDAFSPELPIAVDLKGALALPNELELIIQADPAGTPTSLLNLDEIVALYERVGAAMGEFFNKQGVALPNQAAFLKQLSNPEFVQMSSLREPAIYHLACGASLILGKRIEYDDLLPNPLGSEPLPSKGYFLLVSAKPGDNEATIEWGQKLDPEKTREFIIKFLRGMLPNATAEEFDKQAAAMQLDVEEKATYLFDTKSGRPKTAEYSKVIRVSGQERTDRWRMKLLSAAPQ